MLSSQKLHRGLLRKIHFRQGQAISFKNDAFPWRSLPFPIERVSKREDLSGQNVNSLDRFFRAVVVGHQLQYSWRELLFATWKQPLANDLGWAFQKALGGVLANVFSVPMDDIESEKNGITLDTSIILANTKWTSVVSDKAREYSQNTIDEAILSHYKSVDISQLDVTLSMKVMGSFLESIFLLPFTRSQIADEPSIRDTYRALLLAAREKSPDVAELEKILFEKSDSLSRCTIFADVSIISMEKFEVKNKNTGELLQGYDDGKLRIVYHLVRFEKDSVGDAWKVVDWDDMLEGNTWY